MAMPPVTALDNLNLEERVAAIRVLGEQSDKEDFKALRARLKHVPDEHQALVIAVGQLRRRWGGKIVRSSTLRPLVYPK